MCTAPIYMHNYIVVEQPFHVNSQPTAGVSGN